MGGISFKQHNAKWVLVAVLGGIAFIVIMFLVYSNK